MAYKQLSAAPVLQLLGAFGIRTTDWAIDGRYVDLDCTELVDLPTAGARTNNVVKVLLDNGYRDFEVRYRVSYPDNAPSSRSIRVVFEPESACTNC